MSIRLQLYPIVSRVAAVVLLLAATLKLWPALTDTASEATPWTTVVAGIVELLLGVWLLSGRTPRGSRIAALGCFVVFFNVALLRVLQSVPSCGCFGKVQMQATATTSLDALMVLALLVSSPVLESRPLASGRRLRLAVGALSLVGVIAVFGWQTVLLVARASANSASSNFRRPPRWKSALLNRVLEGVERNHDALHSLEGTLDVTLTTYPNVPTTTRATANKAPGDAPAKAIPRSQRLVLKSRIRGNDLRRDCDSKLADFDAREIRVDAGGKTLQYLPGLQQAWLSADTSLERERTETIDPRCAGFHPPIRNIAAWLRKAELLSETVRDDGKAGEVIQLRVLAQGMQGFQDDVTLDCVAARNYLPSRVVYRSHPKESIFTVADLEYQKVEQTRAWLPKKWSYRSFLRGAATSADAIAGFDLLAETELRLSSVNGDMSDDVFDPLLPPNTRLVGNLAAQARTGDSPVRASAVMLDKPRQPLPRSQNDASPWLWLLAGIDVAAASFFLVYRRSLAL